MNNLQFPLVLDGGLSSQLSKYVKDKIDGDPLWTAKILYTNPEAIVNTHLDYMRAGADIITTNSYQASIDGFQKYLNLSYEQSLKLISESVNLAKKAYEIYLKENNRKILIAGSIGPYGAALHDGSEFSGDYISSTSIKTIREWHKSRLEILVKSGVDLLAFETIPCAKEGDILLELLKEYPEIKAWLSFSCKNEIYTSYGEEFSDVLNNIQQQNHNEQLIAIGVNCLKPQFVEPIFKNKQVPKNMNFIAYPNSGENFDKKLGWTDLEQCVPLYKYVGTWLNCGVKIIGGCCRTIASDISEIRQEINRISSH